MNIEGIFGKLKSNADKLAGVYGFLSPYLATYGDLETVFQHVLTGITHPMLNPMEIISRIQNYPEHRQMIIWGVLAYLFGDAVGNIEGFNIKAIGKNLALGGVAATIFWGGGDHSTPSGSPPSSNYGY